MIYHELDLFILKTILSKEDTTTWDIAKIFPWEENPKVFKDKKEREDFLRLKTITIGNRLKVMNPCGIIDIGKNGKYKNIYIVNREKVILKKQKFPDHTFGYVLWIKEDKENWQCFQI